MKLQNTETANRLNTLTQMKNAIVVCRMNRCASNTAQNTARLLAKNR